MEGAMKNEQSRYTSNIGYIRHRMMTNQAKNTTWEIKNMSITDPTEKTGVYPGACEG